jgi:N-acetylmuramoyl-L-alanine amidase
MLRAVSPPLTLRLVSAILLVVLGWASATAAGSPPSAGTGDALLVVSGSPVRSDGSGRGLMARVRLATPAHVRLRVTDFDGRGVRLLFDGDRHAGVLERRWRGRDGGGRLVPAGAYRVEVIATPVEDTVASDTTRAEAWVTVARGPVDPRPGVITVVVDPGHGGPFDGAIAPDGTREADINLDIGRRLARMLEGAGVDVVLTRDTDAAVNTPAVDRTFDGVVEVTDDLAARADAANAARADVFIAIHNNFAVDVHTGGPSTYYSDERTFRARSVLLARMVQSRIVAALDSVVGGDWRPHDHGILTYPYYVLRDVDPPRLLRPTRMPGVLSEGLFLSNPRELRLLKRANVRQAMANAYYEAITEYLARRGSHVRYELVGAPDQAIVGAPVELEVEVRDTGTTELRGWRLDVRGVLASDLATGTRRSRMTLGERPLGRLARGARRTVRLRITAPTEPGDWVLQVDAIGPRGGRASRGGSPVLEVPLTVIAAGTASPAASPVPATPPASLRP